MFRGGGVKLYEIRMRYAVLYSFHEVCNGGYSKFSHLDSLTNIAIISSIYVEFSHCIIFHKVHIILHVWVRERLTLIFLLDEEERERSVLLDKTMKKWWLKMKYIHVSNTSEATTSFQKNFIMEFVSDVRNYTVIGLKDDAIFICRKHWVACENTSRRGENFWGV